MDAIPHLPWPVWVVLGFFGLLLLRPSGWREALNNKSAEVVNFVLVMLLFALLWWITQ